MWFRSHLFQFSNKLYLNQLEQQQSEGRVDCIVETSVYIYIFEFKLDASARRALQQIEDRGYARTYLTDKRFLFKVGVSFSSKTGTIAEWLKSESWYCHLHGFDISPLHMLMCGFLYLVPWVLPALLLY